MRTAVLLLLAACGAPEPAPARPTPAPEARERAGPERARRARKGRAAPVRGMLAQGDPGLTLSVCDGPTLAVTDATGADLGALLRSVAPGPTDTALVVVVGSREGGALRATAWHSVFAGATCERPPVEGALAAFGEEPFWHVGVHDDRAILRTPDDPEVVFEASAPTDAGGATTWALRPVGGGSPGTLTLTLGVCRHTMADAVYPERATLSLGDRTLQGCAERSGR